MAMRQLVIFVFGWLVISSCGHTNPSATVISDEQKYKSFHLYYASVGMGGSFTSIQPVLDVSGTKFIYTMEQTGFYKGRPIAEPDTLYIGKIQPWAIDSIIQLVARIKDSVVYETNPYIMSGSIEYLIIENDSINLEFTLHNTSDTTAQKVVDVLNVFIPDSLDKLLLFSVPDAKDAITISGNKN